MKIIYHPKVKKNIDKCNKELKNKFKQEIEKIQKTPFKNKQLKGRLKDFRCCKFIFKRVSYRIIYKINENKLILVFSIGSRENFY